MIINKFPKYGDDILNLLDVCYTNPSDIQITLEKPYFTFFKEKKNGNKRPINVPNDKLKTLQKVTNILLRQVSCPPYNFAGYEGQNAYKNALAHKGNFAFLTTDLIDYYQSSKVEYVEDLLINVFKLNKDKEKEKIEFLLKILTYNGYIPTGAPTSPILAFLAHKKLFDEIYEYTKNLDIVFTLYYDDITLSAKHGITMEVVKHIQKILAKHQLRLNPKKTTFYNYKKALITGYYVYQSGKISVPYHFGHDVIKMLEKKAITDMSKTDLRKLIGKINHIQFVDKKAFYMVKKKAYKQFSKIVKKV